MSALSRQADIGSGSGRSIGRLRLQRAVLDFLLFSGPKGVENL
jgi:hypothetical protein